MKDMSENIREEELPAIDMGEEHLTTTVLAELEEEDDGGQTEELRLKVRDQSSRSW